jgi:hypothetical protein
MGAALPRSGGSFDWALMAEGEGAAAAAGARVVELEAQVEALEADLMPISGIGPQFSELLRVVGVGGLSDLRVSNAKDLAERMTAANESGGKRISRRVPTEGAVRDWIVVAGVLKSGVES